MPDVRVYSRPGCHLCEQLLQELLPLVGGSASVEVRNVDQDPAWRQKFGARIPVVEIDGHVVCEIRLDAQAVAAAIRRRENKAGHW
ncbi:MAG: glutaredoxin family protein [Woeseiaceae bacterium]